VTFIGCEAAFFVFQKLRVQINLPVGSISYPWRLHVLKESRSLSGASTQRIRASEGSAEKLNIPPSVR